MTMERRRFIGIAGLAGPVALALLPSRAEGLRSVAGEGGTGNAVLVDTALCTGCGRCEMACAGGNRTPAPPGRTTRVATLRRSSRAASRQCMRCIEPACAAACASGALFQEPSGAVAYRSSDCTGCGSCVTACRSGARRSPEGGGEAAREDRCAACSLRQGAGQAPACVSACASGALAFGVRGPEGLLSRGGLSSVSVVGPSLLVGLHALCLRRDKVRAQEGSG